MASLKFWIKAARLRTLPLALASIALGGFVAALHPSYRTFPVILAGITTLFLQTLSNFANDYGDSKNGIDNAGRIGPKRTVQAGEITPAEMKIAVIFFAALSFISGLLLVFLASGLSLLHSLIFVLTGIGAIAAAIKYTVGKNPYGYAGFGDLFVFLFFGLTGVIGTYILATKSFNLQVFLPASAMGFLSTGVLNLNNMRDVNNDRANGKNTLVVKLGSKKAFVYHCLLILLPFVLLLIFNLLNFKSIYQFSFLILFPLFAVDLVKIHRIPASAELDPFLKKLAMKTLLLTLVFGICNLI
jgi:1,4-dihydroxy-2-naphthoate octaprenyltransferase